MKDFKKIIKYLVPILKNYKTRIFFTFLFVIAGRVLGISIVPLLYKKLIDLIGIGEYLNFESFSSSLIMLGMTLLAVHIIFRFNDYLVAKTQALIMFDLNKLAYKTITQQSYRFFSNNFVGSLVSKMSKFGRAFYSIYDVVLWQFAGTVIALFTVVFIVFSQNIILGFVFLLWSIFYFTTSLLFAKKQSNYDIARSRTDSFLGGLASDIFTNILNIKSFSSYRTEEQNFEKANTASFEAVSKSWNYVNNVRVVMSILQFVFELGIISFTIYLWSISAITTGTIILVLLYIARLMEQLWFLSHAVRHLTNSISDCVEMIEILEQENDLVDPIKPELVRMENGSVSFHNVSFTYPNGDHVFENFDLEIPAGQSVGIVGKSGSGKTTVTKLILRFYDIDNGSITIDHQSVNIVTQDDLRSRISYIPQESILFHRSIYENIAYAKPDATYEEVIQAAKFAHADEFISQFQDGYDTKVGERGVKLSGGQRQRVAIARAMLKKDAPILIMDEATSSLDSLSERYIQESFETLMKNRTTIVVAHRLSTIQKMDRIIVLDGGIIVEDGSHNELLEQGGYYAELWNSQSQEIDNFFE